MRRLLTAIATAALLTAPAFAPNAFAQGTPAPAAAPAGAYVADNYVALAAQAGLDEADLAQLAINSFEASWLTPARRDAYVSAVRDYAAQHGVSLPA